jgi:hypothetical protein
MFEFPVAQGAPNVFVVPNTIAVPAWIDEIRTDWPAWLSHELGVHQVTAVTIHGSHLPAMPVLGEIKGLSFQDNPEWLLEIQFDEGVRNSTMDLRPGLPLVIVY